jgi:hypothetical protein
MYPLQQELTMKTKKNTKSTKNTKNQDKVLSAGQLAAVVGGTNPPGHTGLNHNQSIARRKR